MKGDFECNGFKLKQKVCDENEKLTAMLLPPLLPFSPNVKKIYMKERERITQRSVHGFYSSAGIAKKKTSLYTSFCTYYYLNTVPAAAADALGCCVPDWCLESNESKRKKLF